MSSISAGTTSTTTLVHSGDTTGSLVFKTNDTGSGGTTAVTIDTSQNVGIGITSPSGKLHAVSNVSDGTDSSYAIVAGNLTTSTRKLLLGYNGTGNYGVIQAVESGTAWRDIVMQPNGGNLLVGTTSNIAANAKIFAQGNGVGIAVGYGTGSTAYRHMYMNSGDGTLYFFNPTNYAYLSAAGAWTNASDARLKKNIVDIKYGLADVLKAQPRSYQMNAVDGDFVGFIAQELKKIIPEVVTGDPEKQLGVDYGSLVAVAFKAIQELKAINDTQAETINALTARIVALEGQ